MLKKTLQVWVFLQAAFNASLGTRLESLVISDEELK